MADRKQILAVDIGTSAARAILFDSRATPVVTVRKPYTISQPHPGWSEQDPDTVVKAVIEAIQDGVTALPAESQLSGVVFCSQMYSILALDNTGRPITNSLTWADVRSSQQATDLQTNPQAHDLIARTGCPPQAIYPLSKIRWLKANHDLPHDVRFLSIKDYVLFRLTNQFVTDWSVASTSGMLDIANYCWDDLALKLAEITTDQLPAPVSPRQILEWSPEIIRQTGIASDVPIIIGAGDAPMANIGVGAIATDSVAVNVGTSAAARVLIAQPTVDPSGRLWTYVADEGQWVMGGIIGSGGAVYDWLLSQYLFADQNLSTDLLFKKADELAASVEPGADGLLFIPYLSGEQSPGWNPHAKGLLYGLTLRHEPRHTIRAALEGLTFALLRVAQTIEAVRQTPLKTAYLTGGLTGSQAWLQIIADIFGGTVVVPASPESSARGTAILGWLALGYAQTYQEFFTAPDELGAQQHMDDSRHAFYQQRYQAFCTLNDQLQKIAINQEAVS